MRAQSLFLAMLFTGVCCLPARAERAAYPGLAGTYTFSAQHPRVFMTRSDLNELTSRINTPGSFSARSFARLAQAIAHDLVAGTDWDATYSGCDIDIYLHAFSIEAKGGYAAEVRTEPQLRAALEVKAGAAIPAGAALVASRLALYAALAKAGAAIAAGAPSSGQAATLAKRILLAWADRGFRDEHGHLRQSEVQFCDAAGRVGRGGAPALQISRGVIYSVQAQDLLEGLDAFSPAEQTRLNAFHAGLHDTIRMLSNQEVDAALAGRYPDEIYNNQVACHLAALLASARLLDDKTQFSDALYGGEGAAVVRLPWVSLFDHVVYGQSDTPLLRITPNNGSDPLSSSPAYTTAVVAPGEINDRYRNATPLQGVGYPMSTLQWLFDAAEIIRNAGIDAYSYRGTHQQTIELATQYYACYGKSPGFYKTVTAENARPCPNYQQYIGKVVNQLEPAVLIGALRFPQNGAIAGVEAPARAAWLSSNDSLDAIRFGKWRN